MKKKIVMLVLLVTLLFPIVAKAEIKKENLEQVLTNEGIAHDLSNYKETDDKATIYLFYGHGCGYCDRFLTFINSIVDEYGNYFKIEAYETWNNNDNKKLMNKVGRIMKKAANGVPYIVIGEDVFNGYDTNYDESIKDAIMTLYSSSDRYNVMDHLEESTSDGVFVAIIFGVLILGVGGLILFSRKK